MGFVYNFKIKITRKYNLSKLSQEETKTINLKQLLKKNFHSKEQNKMTRKKTREVLLLNSNKHSRNKQF